MRPTKARLDRKRTAKPKTRLLVTRPHVSDEGTISIGPADTYEDLETGERVDLAWSLILGRTSGIPHVTRTAVWRRGLQLSRTLGLLDSKNRPTFEFPTWNYLKERREAIWDYCKRSRILPVELVS